MVMSGIDMWREKNETGEMDENVNTERTFQFTETVESSLICHTHTHRQIKIRQIIIELRKFNDMGQNTLLIEKTAYTLKAQGFTIGETTLIAAKC